MVILKARREGYAPKQCETMTIGELIDYLENFDKSEPIYLSHDNGYTYGGIKKNRFYQKEEERDEEEE